MVRVDALPVSRTISRSLVGLTNNQIVPIISNDIAVFQAEFGITERCKINGFISELRAFSSIKSLSSVPIPDFSITDSDTDKILKTQQLMWGDAAARFDLCLWSAGKLNPSASEWILEGILPLTNSAGYPYTLHNPLDLLTTNLAREFGENTSFGVSIKDAGWGLPSVLDTINIVGGWKQDCRIIQPDYIPVPINVQGATVQSVVQYRNENTANTALTKRTLLEANTKRISASIKNNSGSATLYLSETDVTPTASVNDGTVAPGATRAIRAGYVGAIYGAASATGTSTTSVEIFNQ